MQRLGSLRCRQLKRLFTTNPRCCLHNLYNHFRSFSNMSSPRLAGIEPAVMLCVFVSKSQNKAECTPDKGFALGCTPLPSPVNCYSPPLILHGAAFWALPLCFLQCFCPLLQCALLVSALLKILAQIMQHDIVAQCCCNKRCCVSLFALAALMSQQRRQMDW